jgi:phosphoribosylformylglycinamidine cyclo-ligase
MRRTFNCGVGMIAVVDENDVEQALATLRESGEQAWRLGRICAGQAAVQYL